MTQTDTGHPDRELLPNKFTKLYSPTIELTDAEREQLEAGKMAFIQGQVMEERDLVSHIALAFTQGAVFARNLCHRPAEIAESQRKSIHENGVLTDEAKAIADPQFDAAQKAAEPIVKSIENSRRLSGGDMAWRATPIAESQGAGDDIEARAREFLRKYPCAAVCNCPDCIKAHADFARQETKAISSALAELVTISKDIESEINAVGSVAIGTFECFTAAIAKASPLIDADKQEGER